jgi:nucleoside phosphorylase
LRRTNARVAVIPVQANNEIAQETTMRALYKQRIERALVTGVCGLLSQELAPGDALIYGDVRSQQFEPVLTDAALNEQLRAIFPEAFAGAHGLTWGSVVTSPDEKLMLASRYRANAVDTESFGIVAALVNAGVKCAVLRFGSDGASDRLPDLNAGVRADGSIDGGRLTLEMLRQPIAGARLVMGGSVAISRLARAIRRIDRATPNPGLL